jgi:hypothetical protein
MSYPALRSLDVFFFVFHTAVIFFNMFGWVRRSWRKWHVALVLITAFSWFGLGWLMGYGVGYCFCTDWHWQVRRAAGLNVNYDSYLQLLFEGIGLNLTSFQSNVLAYGVFGLMVLAMFFIDVPTLIRDARARRGL